MTAEAVECARGAADGARDEVVPAIGELLESDIDDQRTTPLELVRRAVPYATAALEELGVPPLVRDAFSRERFPDDVYALIPASLAELDEETGELAIVWGASKAFEHRRRHGGHE